MCRNLRSNSISNNIAALTFLGVTPGNTGIKLRVWQMNIKRLEEVISGIWLARASPKSFTRRKQRGWIIAGFINGHHDVWRQERRDYSNPLLILFELRSSLDKSISVRDCYVFSICTCWLAESSLCVFTWRHRTELNWFGSSLSFNLSISIFRIVIPRSSECVPFR